MRVFVAGGSAVLGLRLVPQPVARGHQVTATTSAARLGLLQGLGADGVVMDGLDAASVGEAVAQARPDTIVHQMTAIAGKPDMKHMERWFATTNRLRTEGTDHLPAVADATGVSHVVAQGDANRNGIREGGWVKTEEDPLDSMAGTSAAPGMEAIRHVEERVVGAGGAMRVPVRPARLPAGEAAVVMMTEGRAFSNAEAKRQLGRELRYPSWRQGFEKEPA
ncbi:sugar nucleotide-binding protein [Streptomyces carpinensis]|uniref:Sugar nucleotide-binding protein n=1 Tax=Streptomyces carpinensis TaxID=66369 RepID=A0ABV1VZ69_9ACTN|nr:sugar nucleotide-binding protein [Streptomyces carpinensis]